MNIESVIRAVDLFLILAVIVGGVIWYLSVKKSQIDNQILEKKLKEAQIDQDIDKLNSIDLISRVNKGISGGDPNKP